MRVFVAGATGVIGRPLVAALLAAGHEVTGMTRSRAAAEQLASKGAEPVVSDAYDAEAAREAVVKAEPQVVVHQLTALPRAIDPRRIGEQLADNDRLRVQGTRNLLRAAVLAGAGRLVAQSIAFAYAPVGGPVKGEDAPLWLDAFEPWRRSVRVIADLEHHVTTTPGIEGVVLRYGNLYGPATAYAADGAVADLVRARRYPIAGKGAGVYSFVHLDDAVAATQAGAGVAGQAHGGPLRRAPDDHAAWRRQHQGQADPRLGTDLPKLADRVPDRTRIGGARPVGDSEQVRRL